MSISTCRKSRWPGWPSASRSTFPATPTPAWISPARSRAHQPENRSDHAQRADRSDLVQPEAPVVAGHVRQRQGQHGREKAIPDPAADGDYLQPLRLDRVRRRARRQEGCAEGRQGQPALVAQQVFVTTGATRGDQVAILTGLKAGQQVVTSGQIKFKNGTPVVVDNTVSAGQQPEPDSARTLEAKSMKFTDIFIRRPVLAIVVSLLIVVLGMRSLFSLPINQYPAHPECGGDGVDRLLRRRCANRGRLHHATAGIGDCAGAGDRLPVVVQSSSGMSTITATLRLNYDANRALDRNQYASQFGQEPVAGAGATAGADGASRADHRRDVHGLLQRHAADQQRHRLPGARGQTQARFDRGRANRRTARRAPVCAARLAGRSENGGASALPLPMSAPRWPTTTIWRRWA